MAKADVACCSTTVQSKLDRSDAERIASALKAVADPTRLQLLSFLRHQADSEACVCDLAAVVGLSQPTVSHHLKVLVEAGLLTRSRRGYWAWYTLDEAAMRNLANLLP